MQTDLLRLIGQSDRPIWLFDRAGARVLWRNAAARRAARGRLTLERNGQRGIVRPAGKAAKGIAARLLRWRLTRGATAWLVETSARASRRHAPIVADAAIVQSALDAMSEGVAIVDQDLNYRLLNQRFLEFFCLPADMIRPGLNDVDVARFQARRGDFGPGDVEELVAHRRNLTRRLQRQNYVRRMTDGRLLEFDFRPLPTGGFLRVYRDITARQDETKTALTQIMDAAETLTEGLAIFGADEQLIICNNRYKSFCPAIASQIIPGATAADLVRAIAELGLIAEIGHDRDAWLAERLRAFRALQGLVVDKLADGRIVQSNRYKTFSGGTVVMVRDITAEKGGGKATA